MCNCGLLLTFGFGLICVDCCWFNLVERVFVGWCCFLSLFEGVGITVVLCLRVWALLLMLFVIVLFWYFGVAA